MFGISTLCIPQLNAHQAPGKMCDERGFLLIFPQTLSSSAYVSLSLSHCHAMQLRSRDCFVCFLLRANRGSCNSSKFQPLIVGKLKTM